MVRKGDIVFAQRGTLGKSAFIVNDIGELIIAVYIGRIFLHWVLHSQDGRILSSLCIEHTDTVRVFHGEVDVLKDFLPLATSTKGIDRYGHANADCHEK
jgi:hypothetical protein